MKPSLRPGVSRVNRMTVGAERTIGFMGEEARTYATPAMIRDIGTAELVTGAPAGVLASISEREFSHNTVAVPGSIPGTVSSRGYRD